jgi:hypothetical protein
MANAPLLGTGWHELVEMICPTSKVEYFLKEGWTLICPTGGDLPVGQNGIFLARDWTGQITLK